MMPYIDCVRGYAVVLVILCHLVYAYPGTPYPVHRLATFGWHGVQLFFLASAVTLLLSWHAEVARHGRASFGRFLIRRVFRIAPAYFAAALLYGWMTPPENGLDPVQVLAALAFVNVWTPHLMGTVPHGWSVVPGGWSVGVEFTFYAIFPLFAAFAGGLRRALLLVALCAVAGVASNLVAAALLARSYAPLAVDNFLYFWFPNQMIVFALGGALYFALKSFSGRRAPDLLARHGTLMPAIALTLFYATAWLKLPHWLGGGWPFVPGFVVATVCLAGFVLALGTARRSLFVNPLAAAMGRVSFSAYLLHYAVILITIDAYPALFHTGATGWLAIAAFAAGCIVVLGVVFLLSWCSFQLVERPMIRLGGKVARLRWPAVAHAR